MSARPEPDELLLRHSRSTRSEGKRMLARVALVAAAVTAVILLIPEVRALESSGAGVALGLFVLVAAIGIAYAVYNLRSSGEFVVELDRNELRCETPVRGVGETFRVAIADIRKVERHDLGEVYSWSVVDTSGERYPLVGNYGNPVSRIVELILELNPTVEEVHA